MKKARRRTVVAPLVERGLYSSEIGVETISDRELTVPRPEPYAVCVGCRQKETRAWASVTWRIVLARTIAKTSTDVVGIDADVDSGTLWPILRTERVASHSNHSARDRRARKRGRAREEVGQDATVSASSARLATSGDILFGVLVLHLLLLLNEAERVVNFVVVAGRWAVKQSKQRARAHKQTHTTTTPVPTALTKYTCKQREIDSTYRCCSAE